MIKPIPSALYQCRFCSDQYTWPADDLFWSEITQDWVCDLCFTYELIDRERRGISLRDEITRQQSNTNEPTPAEIEQHLRDTIAKNLG